MFGGDSFYNPQGTAMGIMFSIGAIILFTIVIIGAVIASIEGFSIFGYKPAGIEKRFMNTIRSIKK